MGFLSATVAALLLLTSVPTVGWSPNPQPAEMAKAKSELRAITGLSLGPNQPGMAGATTTR
jgi:hypothetical protein